MGAGGGGEAGGLKVSITLAPFSKVVRPNSVAYSGFSPS